MKTKIDRYTAYNINRKIKAIHFKESKAIFLFKIVPFLLHCNYPDLPGFVEDPECPFGIHRFVPEKFVSKELFLKYFPSSSALSDSTPSPFARSAAIHSLKTIGSIGTIAQTEKSDCDFWVSIRRPELGAKGLPLLSRKCKAIEEWAATQGHEIYFFLMDIDETRENSFVSDAEEESAGSALKILLKDELFRTHILVAGKMLLWWLIPPGLTVDEYRHYVKQLQQEKKIDLNNFVDLGYLASLPKAEIFGACLWQMNKALDSPFKSVIKFAYLELLLRDKSQELSLFSETIKCLVTFPEHLNNRAEEELALAEIDPYLLLARRIVAFYKAEETAQKRDGFIRECLFLKTLEDMESQKKRSGQNQLKDTMALMEKWQLLPDNLNHFTNFLFWSPKEMIEAGGKVHAYLIETYKKLRWIFKTFEHEHGVTITERDLSILGRKLFTFYEKKPLKIEYIKSLSREAMAQLDITIHANRIEGEDVYYAFQGDLDHNTIRQRTAYIIKKENRLLQLLTWMMVNGILTRETKIHLTKNYLPINLVDIQSLVEVLLATFPPVNFAHISADQLLKEETIVQALAVINFAKEPVRGAKTLNSTLVWRNSYGEYFVQDFTTLAQYKNALRVLLTKHFVSRWNKNLEIFIPPQPEQHVLQQMLEG